MCFPFVNLVKLGFLVNKLENLAFEYADKKDLAAHPDWLVQVLHDIKIPFSTIFQVYHDIFEAKLPPWSSNRALVYIIRIITVLLQKWMSSVRSLGPYQRSFF